MRRACLRGCRDSRGLALQAYFIFSIGNIRPLLVAEYPECWKSYTECSKTLTEAPDYTQIIGKSSPIPADLHAALLWQYSTGWRSALGSGSMGLLWDCHAFAKADNCITPRQF